MKKNMDLNKTFSERLLDDVYKTMDQEDFKNFSEEVKRLGKTNAYVIFNLVSKNQDGLCVTDYNARIKNRYLTEAATIYILCRNLRCVVNALENLFKDNDLLADNYKESVDTIDKAKIILEDAYYFLHISDTKSYKDVVEENEKTHNDQKRGSIWERTK